MGLKQRMGKDKAALPQTTVRIRLHAAVVRVSSVPQPASAGTKCYCTMCPGMGTKGDTQAWSSPYPLSNCDEGGMARWDWRWFGSLRWSIEEILNGLMFGQST